MAIEDVEGDLWRAYQDWHPLLANPRPVRRGSTISWQAYEGAALPADVSVEEFVQAVERQQYSFQNSIDGGVFQLWYAFDDSGQEMQAARLAYLTLLPLRDVLDDPEGNGEYEGSCWLRLEYDPERQKGLPHAPCHMHLAGFPGRRLVVRGVPTPRQFVEWVFAFIYPMAFQERHLDARGFYRDHERVRELRTPELPMDGEYCSDHITALIVLRHPCECRG